MKHIYAWLSWELLPLEIPFLFLLMIQLLNPDYLQPLIEAPVQGVLKVGLLLITTFTTPAAFLMRRARPEGAETRLFPLLDGSRKVVRFFLILTAGALTWLSLMTWILLPAGILLFESSANPDL